MIKYHRRVVYDDIVEIARRRPDVEEALSYGAPSLKRRGRFMIGLKADGETISVKLDWDNRDRLLHEYPETIYITPHFHGWPGFLVRMPLLTRELAEELIALSYDDAPKPSKRRAQP